MPSDTPSSYRRHALFRRGVLAGATVGTTLGGATAFGRFLSSGGTTALEWVLIGLFAINFAWIALSFWTTIPGFFVELLRWRQPGLARPGAAERARPLKSRTAILMPVYNEETSGTFGNLEAIWESLAATGLRDAFDIFILSDTTDPEVWVQEELAWAEFCRRVGSEGRIFYRKRRDNTARKAGNIADFCRRWGRAYDFMVVLDADSVMDGKTLVELARLMELNPRAGIIQAPNQIVNRRTGFARAIQFASGLYGPVVASGLAFWSLGDGNYWGHNAIIRTRAFIECCGLPRLAGRPPFGGHILSHDFVEAALIRRAGWTVWLDTELSGSYEEPPPTLIDYAQRDRRWAQGNMQHMRVIVAKGLNPMSRVHLGMGIMSYLSSPLWLLFLLCGLAVAFETVTAEPVYFPDETTLYPVWPIFHLNLAENLLFVSLGMLFAPKILGLLLIYLKPSRARRYGGVLSTTVSVIVESLFSVLLAPVMMLFHSSFVAGALLGFDTGWKNQNRDDRGTSWAEGWKRHKLHMVFGVALGLASYAISPMMLAWASPLVVALLLAVPTSVLSSRPAVGLALMKLGLLRIPEEIARPRVLARAEAIAKALEASRPLVRDWLQAVIVEPRLNALHLGLLAATSSPEPDRAAVSRALSRLGGPTARPDTRRLDREDRIALLSDAETLERLHLAALASPGSLGAPETETTPADRQRERPVIRPIVVPSAAAARAAAAPIANDLTGRIVPWRP